MPSASTSRRATVTAATTEILLPDDGPHGGLERVPRSGHAQPGVAGHRPAQPWVAAERGVHHADLGAGVEQALEPGEREGVKRPGGLHLEPVADGLDPHQRRPAVQECGAFPCGAGHPFDARQGTRTQEAEHPGRVVRERDGECVAHRSKRGGVAPPMSCRFLCEQVTHEPGFSGFAMHRERNSRSRSSAGRPWRRVRTGRAAYPSLPPALKSFNTGRVRRDADRR